MLAFLVPWWNFKKEAGRYDAQKHAAANSAGSVGILAVGGALASQEEAKRQSDAFARIATALERLAEAESGRAAATRQRGESFQDMLDETHKLRRTLEEIAGLMRQRREPPRRDDT